MLASTVDIHIPNRLGIYRCQVSCCGCWLWPSIFRNSGYGRVKVGGRGCVAHRVVYEQVRGKIHEGLQLDHLCRVRSCVNPDHLEPVTPRENQRRGKTFTKEKYAMTHCINGHELRGANLFIRANGSRRCQKCEKERQRISRQKPEYKAKHAAYERMRRLKLKGGKA